MRKKVLIIGAGISGLSAGCYLQMNGYDTEIFELHTIPGGLCTGWKRKGYTFDGCIHWLCGTNPEDEFHTIWEELGALQDKQIVNHEMFSYSDLGNGETFAVYADVDKLEHEMLRFAPEDEKLIKEFTHAIRVTKKAKMPVLKPQEQFGALDGMKLMFKAFSLIKVLNKWDKVSLKDFQEKFRSPFFSQNFVNLFGMYEEMPLFALIYTLGLLSNHDAGYPVGGSLEFAKSIEKRYVSLGGKIHYAARVEKILVEDGKASGIKLADETVHAGDIVISAADGHYTLYNMLDGKYLNEEIESCYKNYKRFPSIIQVSLGIAREFTETPDTITNNIALESPIHVDPHNTVNKLGVKFYSFDPTFAPKGKTAVVTFFDADYTYWTELKRNSPEKYRQEKERVAADVIKALDKKYRNVHANIEATDVATPDTFVRYTNNWMGSFEGFIPTVENFKKRIGMTLPGLENFYMIGQWVQPGGGLPTGGIHGRHLTQTICRKDGKEFVTVK